MKFTTAESQIDLSAVLNGTQVPGLPRSAIHLMELSNDPNNGPAEFAVPLNSDPGLLGQVLRYVNSSYFGFDREISNVVNALALVGIRSIKNFVLWSAVFDAVPNPKCGSFDLRSLWQDSLQRAIFARKVGKLVGATNTDDLFTAAALQDVAVPILVRELPQHYANLLQERIGGQVRLSELGKKTFGWDHAEAGGLLARNWNLPESFAVLIERHTDSGPFADGHVDLGIVAVSLSSLLPSTSDTDWFDREDFFLMYRSLISDDAYSIVDVFQSVDDEMIDLAFALNSSTPSQSLSDRLHEESSFRM